MASTTEEEMGQCRAQMAAIFRKIIRQEYAAADIGKLIDVTFDFQTVYKRSENTHRHFVDTACSCAFQHEYITYFDENQIIDVAIFDQLCASIENGKCKHVSSAKSNDIATTSVSAFQVAIATGYQSTLEHVQGNTTTSAMLQSTSAIFRLNDFHIAMLKGHYAYLDEGAQSIKTESIKDPEANRLFDTFVLVKKEPSSEILKVEPCMTLLRYFANSRNMELFQRLLARAWIGPDCINEILHFIVEDDFIALEALLAHVSNYTNSSKEEDRSLSDTVVSTVLSTAVFKDSERSLRILEEFVLNTNNFDKIDEWTFLENGPFFLDCAITLGHDACVEILSRHIHPRTDEEPLLIPGLGVLGHIARVSGPSQKVHGLIQDVCCKLVTKGIIDENGTVYVDNRFIRLDIFGLQCTSRMLTDLKTHYVCAARSIFQTGNGCISKLANNALMTAVSAVQYWFKFKPIWIYYLDDLLRFVLFHNPDLTQINRQQLMHLAIRSDVVKHLTKLDIFFKTHAADFQKADSIAFTMPMLWECGLEFSMNDLIENENFDRLPECVRIFLANTNNKPRSLQMQCRDRIRRDHVGLQVHAVLKTAICPAALKRYILMEDTLGMTDQTECLCQTQKKFVPIS